MVYQRDYILRMIERIGELVTGILGLIRKGELDLAGRAIGEAYAEVLREEAAFFQGMPTEDLTDRLLREHNYTNGHLEVLSELFFAEAEWSHAGGMKAESLRHYQRSLKLLEFVMKESRVFSLEKQARVAYIKKRLRSLAGGSR